MACKPFEFKKWTEAKVSPEADFIQTLKKVFKLDEKKDFEFRIFISEKSGASSQREKTMTEH